MPLHADQHGASRQVGNAINRAGELGFLTTANVQSATTPAGIQALITAGSAHADQQPLKSRLNRQIDIGIADGTLTNATVAAATGVNNLASLSESDDRRTYGGPVE